MQIDAFPEQCRPLLHGKDSMEADSTDGTSTALVTWYILLSLRFEVQIHHWVPVSCLVVVHVRLALLRLAST